MIIYLLIYLISIFFINETFIKKKKLLNNTGFNHQTLVNESVPLTGGIFLLMPAFYFFLPNHPYSACAYFLLFLIGLLSDLKIFVSAKKRFLSQLLVTLLFVITIKLEVTPTKIIFFDELLSNVYWSYIFTVFCLMILINGSNFIDGLNGLLLGYFGLIILILFQQELLHLTDFSEKKLFYFICVIFFVLILNFFNKLFLGDGGAYSLSFLIGLLLIKIYNFNQNVSPYFIILLLWYPCFENLFSIVRKIMIKANPLDPDTGHIHQKLFIVFKKRFNMNNFKSNTLSSILILMTNFVIFFIASYEISHSFFQICLLGLSVLLYLIVYKLLDKLNKF